MESKGQIKDVVQLAEHKYRLTIDCEDKPEEMTGDLRITIKQWKEKRSLSANGLLWSMIGTLSHFLNEDKWKIYLLMLKRYGKYTYTVIKPSAVEKFKEMWRECEEVGKVNVNGTEGVQMLCYFGSSTYDSKEMSALIEGVKSELEELGLETPASAEMRRVLDELNHTEG